MVCTKNTARKQHLGLPRARFPVVPTSRSERDLHYQAQLQLPSEDADWTTLMPTFTVTESPEVGRAVDRINEEHANPPPQTINEVCDLVQDLRAPPPTSPVKDPVIQADCEQPAATTPPTPTLFTETVAETVCPPLLLARRATATPARDVAHPPTITTKCPRKEYRANEEMRRKPKRPKALSALREIQKLQEEVEPILRWEPFIRLIYKLLFARGPYRIQRQAIQALRAAAEAYIVEVLGGGNLACMHRDRCTLTPKDIQLFRRLQGAVDLMGETPESEEARRADWRRYKKDRLTPGEALVLDTTRHHKLRSLIQRRRQKIQKSLKH